MRYWFGIIGILLWGCPALVAGKRPASVPIADTHRIDRVMARAEALTLIIPDSARKLAEQSLILSKKINYSFGIGKSFYHIGMSYWTQSFIPVSQFYLTLAMPYLKDHNDALATCYRCMGRNYVDLKQYEQGQYYFDKAIRLAAGNINGKAEIYTEMTSLFLADHEYNKCLSYIDTAMRYSRAAKNQGVINILYNRLGQVYIETNKPDKAERVLDTCYQLTQVTRNQRLEAITLMDKARVMIMWKRYPAAIDFAQHGYDLANALGSLKFRLRAIGILSQAYELQHNITKAYELEKEGLELRRQLERLNNRKAIELVNDYATLNQKLNNIEALNRRNVNNESQIKAQHRMIALLVALLITAVIILAIIYFYYREKQILSARLQQQHQSLLDQKQLIEVQRTDLEEVNQIKNKLLAIIGHDLRTPIANLSSIASMFAEGHLTTEELEKLMIDIVPMIRGAELTLANLTDFAGSQIKGNKVSLSKVDICAVVNETEEILRPQLKKKSIIFHNNCQANHHAMADANHVKVVMRNLISNAIKFTDHKGHIDVSYRTNGNLLTVCVEDNGIGMTPEQAAKLFNYQEHFSQKGTMGENGTGLGLILCKELVALNGGRLWLETNPGEGCRVFCSLQIAE